VDIALTVATPGVMRCGAMPTGPDSMIDLKMIDMQRHEHFAVQGGSFGITVDDLIPGTTYDVFCYMTSARDHRSTILSAGAMKETVTTHLSRDIYVDLQMQSIYQHEGALDTLVVHLEYPPDEAVFVDISAYVLEGDTSTLAYSQELKYTHQKFGKRSMPLPNNATYGEFVYYNATLRGPSADQYSLVFRGGVYLDVKTTVNTTYTHIVTNTTSGNHSSTSTSSLSPSTLTTVWGVRVLNTAVALRIPDVLSVIMSTDSSSVVVTFSADTDRAYMNTSHFACSRLLDFTGAGNASCRWLSLTALSVQLDSTTILKVGDSVSLTGDVRAVCLPGHYTNLMRTDPGRFHEMVLKTVTTTDTVARRLQDDVLDCTSWEVTPHTTWAIGLPTSGYLLKPRVDVTGPSEVTMTDHLWFTTYYSQGHGGQPWKSVKFVVNTPNRRSSLAENYLNSQVPWLGGEFQRIQFPPGYLPDGLYHFFVTMCNYLDNCGTSDLHVYVRDEPAVMVNILGPHTIEISAGDEFTLFSETSMDTRDEYGNVTDRVSRTSFKYKWFILSNGVIYSTHPTTGIPSHQEFMHLIPYQFLSGQTYEVRLVVVSNTTRASASSSVILMVRNDPLTALIVGSDRQTVAPGACLSIDGSNSFDMQQLNNIATMSGFAGLRKALNSPFTGLAAGLKYTWSCRQSFPVVSTECGFSFSTTNQSQVLVLCSETGLFPSESTITMAVHKDDRVAYTTVVVATRAQDEPVLTVENKNSEPNPTASNFNPQSGTKIIANVSSLFNGTAFWTVNDSSIDLVGRALTPVSTSWYSVNDSISTLHPMNLFLLGNTLPGRSAITFTLNCVYGNNTLVTASTVVLTNGAPIRGSFSARPEYGVAWTDIFTLSAWGWFDEDLPLYYLFSYVSPTGAALAVQSRSDKTFAESMLPLGSSVYNDSLWCRVDVYDFYLANTTMRQEVFTRFPQGIVIPSSQPTGQPSAQPSGEPTAQPSTEPTGQPSSQPSSQPSAIPSSQPSSQPSRQPSGLPTGEPTGQPSGSPSGHPSSQPSASPSAAAVNRKLSLQPGEYWVDRSASEIALQLIQSNQGEMPFLEVVKIVNLGASALNYVECRGSSNCSDFNREHCQYTENTCGPCKSTYMVGIPGDSDTYCYEPDHPHLATPNISCNVDDDCFPWEMCNTTAPTGTLAPAQHNGTCLLTNKHCPAHCSGNGVCGWEDTLNGNSTTSCLWDDTNCRAVCTCDDEWFGTSCTERASEKTDRQAMRAGLTVELGTVVYMGLYDTVAFDQWLRALNSLIQRPEELSPHLVNDLTVTTWHYLNASEALKISLHSAEPLLNVFDKLTSARAIEGKVLRLSLIEVGQDVAYLTSRTGLLKVGDLMLQNMVAGQVDLLYIEEFLRMAYVSKFVADPNDKSLEIPLTPLQGYVYASYPSLTAENTTHIVGAPLLRSLTAAVGTLDDRLWLDGVRFLSHPVLLDVSYLTALANGGAQTFTAGISFNHSLAEYNSTEPAVQPDATATCEEGNVTSYSWNCNNGYNVSIDCDGVFFGVIHASCPYDAEVPRCVELWESASATEDGCEVTESGPYHTSCNCRIAVADNFGAWAFSSGVVGAIGIEYLQDRRNLATTPLPMVNMSQLSGRRSNSSFEVVPVVLNKHFPSVMNYTHGPTMQPTLAVTAAPSQDRAYNIISFGVRSYITWEYTNTSLIKEHFPLSEEDRYIAVNATWSVFWQTMESNVSFIDTQFSTKDVNGTTRFYMTMEIESYLTQENYCDYQSAYDAFAELLREAVEDQVPHLTTGKNTSIWAQYVRNSLNDMAKSSAFESMLPPVPTVDDDPLLTVVSEPYGLTDEIKTSAYACTHPPSFQPSSTPNTFAPSIAGAGDQGGGSTTLGGGSSSGDSSMSSAASFDYIALYVIGLVLFVLLSLFYVCYSNRNRAVIRLDEASKMVKRLAKKDKGEKGDDFYDGDVVEAVEDLPDRGSMVFNEASGEFDFDYDGQEAEGEEEVPTTAFDWTDADVPVSPRPSFDASEIDSVDASARSVKSPSSKSPTRSFLNPFSAGKAKAKTALNLGALRERSPDKASAAPREEAEVRPEMWDVDGESDSA